MRKTVLISEETATGVRETMVGPLAEEMIRLRDALRMIANLPMPEQDDMLSANMRKIASEALSIVV